MKLLRIGDCFKSKTDAVPERAIAALGSACSPLPLMLLPVDSTGEGQPLKFLAGLKPKKIPDPCDAS